MTRWIVLVGPAADCLTLLNTTFAGEALESIHVLRMAAPSLRIALYRWEPTTGACVRVLRIERGVRYDELPELLAEVVPPPAEPAIGATSNASFESPVFVRCRIDLTGRRH